LNAGRRTEIKRQRRPIGSSPQKMRVSNFAVFIHQLTPDEPLAGIQGVNRLNFPVRWPGTFLKLIRLTSQIDERVAIL
jgi:hypothetical protein